MKLKSRVGRGISRAGKLVKADGKVLKSTVHLVLRSMSTYYSFSRVRPMIPRRMSTYYLQGMTYYL